MPFLVRKLNKRDQLYQLSQKECIDDIYADVPTSEFRTTQGTLSTWIIDSIEDIEDAVLAIAVSSTKISRMDFIIIDTELLDNYELKYEKTYAGIDIPIPDLQDTHYDILDISLKKIKNCANVYKYISQQEIDGYETYIVRYSENQIKEILKNAILSDRVDKTKASRNIREVIEKMVQETS